MSTEQDVISRDDSAIEVEAADIAAALRTLQPNNRHRKSKLISKLYPAICEMLQQNVTQKAILELLETKGLKLHPTRFKEMMQAEAASMSDSNATSVEAVQ